MPEVSDLKGLTADAKDMVTDDIPDRNAAAADFLSAFGSATARHGWSTVAADWFEAEPMAGGMRAAFLELYRRASAEQIADALEGIWLMLDRGALWVSSIHADLAANSTGLVDQTCAALLPTIPRRIYTITCLGRASLDHLPTAMAAARAAFEAGLRLAWINDPQDPQERAIRVLLIHSSQAKWKRKVASDYDLTRAGGGGAARGRPGAGGGPQPDQRGRRPRAGRVVPPLGTGEGVLVVEDGGDYRVEPLDVHGGG